MLSTSFWFWKGAYKLQERKGGGTYNQEMLHYDGHEALCHCQLFTCFPPNFREAHWLTTAYVSNVILRACIVSQVPDTTVLSKTCRSTYVNRSRPRDSTERFDRKILSVALNRLDVANMDTHLRMFLSSKVTVPLKT